jgi:hypothetical protein
MEKAKKDLQKIAMAGTAAVLIPILLSTTLVTSVFAAPTLHGPITCTIISQNRLQCTLNVSGLGGATKATAKLTTTATVTTGCINQGENEPRGLQRSTTTQTATQTVNVEGGRATFTLTTQPLSASALRHCPDHMTPTIVCVTFSNISIQVIPNSGQSRTFPVSGSRSTC